MQVSKDELFKLKMVGSNLAKEIREIKGACAPEQDKNKDKDKDRKGKGRWRKTGDGVHEVTAEENIPTNDAAQRILCSPDFFSVQLWFAGRLAAG